MTVYGSGDSHACKDDLFPLVSKSAFRTIRRSSYRDLGRLAVEHNESNYSLKVIVPTMDTTGKRKNKLKDKCCIQSFNKPPLLLSMDFCLSVSECIYRIYHTGPDCTAKCSMIIANHKVKSSLMIDRQKITTLCLGIVPIHSIQYRIKVTGPSIRIWARGASWSLLCEQKSLLTASETNKLQLMVAARQVAILLIKQSREYPSQVKIFVKKTQTPCAQQAVIVAKA
ncbi:hypothetical protein BY458DRAFT_490615 [Sporodiniella umbellata]|nr:hypothetical protein BY458DRAFT_490615 [Sporodiniella umbellata]